MCGVVCLISLSNLLSFFLSGSLTLGMPGSTTNPPPSSLPSLPSLPSRVSLKGDAKVAPRHPTTLSLASNASVMNFGTKNLDLSLLNMMDKDLSEEQTPKMEMIRLKVKKFIAASFFGQLYVNTLLVLSILSCLQYIYSTYLSGNTASGREILAVFSILELCLAALFAFDWCLNLFVADHKSEFFFSFFALVDFTTVIPIWLTFFIFKERVSYYEINSFYDLMDYILHAAYTLRILRALRIHRKLIHIEDEVHRFLSQMVLSLLTMMLFEAALMQYLESHVQRHPFHTWIYYIVVTTSTVGYGDITPSGAPGRFMAMFIITFAIIFVPQQTNVLIEKMNRSTIWSRAVYTDRGNQKHVIICGDLKSTSISEFFNELFHEDHDIINLNAVILQPDPPSVEMQTILRNPNFSLVTHYLQGTPLNDVDLERAKANNALAIFLMGNKFSSNPDEEDAKTILQQFSIKRFIQSTQSSDPLFCLQLIRPENRRHLAHEDPDKDKQLVVCLNELKMGVMAKTCLFPGTSTMIFNLLTSFADGDDDDDDSSSDEGEADEIGSDAGSSEDDEDGGSWISEYQKGCDWEIYTTEIAEKFVGVKFHHLATKLYLKLGIVLFALRVTELKGKGHIRILLNPYDYAIPPTEKYFVEGFVIAKNKAASNLSTKGEDSSEGRSSQLALISNAISKTAEVGQAIRRQSMAVVLGPNGGMKKVDLNPIKASPEKSTQAGWQSVMNQFDHEDDQNHQEALQKIEDDNLRKNYFVREQQLIHVNEVTVESAILEEYPLMSGHMIVIAKSLSNLYDYIKPLRAKSLGKLRHIVILHPFDILDNVWRRLCIFEGLLIVKGSPLEETDIIRAGVFRASQVVVLADPTIQLSIQGTANRNREALVDADAIFTYHAVKRLNEKAQILIEIVNHNNVSYLDTTLTMQTHESDYKFTPHFASGTLMTSSMLDSIVCQAFYNPQIIRVIDKLITGNDCIDSKERNPLLSRRTKGGLQAVGGSALYQINIPDSLQTRTYGKLWEELSKENILPLGILRGVFANMSTGAKGNKMSYVYTNPHRDTELFTCDRVFVLSPKTLTGTKMSMKDILKEFQTQSSHTTNPEGKKKMEEVLSVDTLKVEAIGVSDCQKKMEHNVSAATANLTLKVNLLLERVNQLKAHSVSSISTTTSSVTSSVPSSPAQTQQRPVYPKI